MTRLSGYSFEPMDDCKTQHMNRRLDVATAIFAFIAAVFWFLSAAGRLPPMVMYWDQAPDTDTFYQAMKFSSFMNMIASVFSGLSAALFAINEPPPVSTGHLA